MKSMIDRAKKEVEANKLWIQEHKKQLCEAGEKRKQVIQKKAGQILIMILGSRFIQRKRLPFIY